MNMGGRSLKATGPRRKHPHGPSISRVILNLLESEPVEARGPTRGASSQEIVTP
jgi:hypothetical protein